MGTFLSVHAVELAGVLAAAAALAAAMLRRVLLHRRAVPAGVIRFAEGIPDALGDAVLAIDPAGQILHANPAAARLTGTSVAQLIDRHVAEIAPDLAALTRGLERGPTHARFALRGPAGPVWVLAALARVTARPPRALAVLRVLPRPLPPPLPPLPAAPRPGPGQGRAALDAAAEALRIPLAEAEDALALLRLAAPPLPARARAALAAAETAVEVASRRAMALAAAAQQSAARRAVDLAALVEDVVATFPMPLAVRVTLELGAARAFADDRPLRAALREILAAAAAVPGSGEIAVATRERAARAMVEIRTRGSIGRGGLALARALVVPQGGNVEEEAVPGSGPLVRVALEGAPALAPA